MDGLDIQCRPTERNPGRIALDRHFGSSHIHRVRQGSWKWYRAYYRRRVHHRFVLGVRLFIITHGMRTLTPNQPIQGQAGGRGRLRNLGQSRQSALTDISQLAYVATDSGTPYLAEYTGAQAGQMACYWLRWINTRGEKGPWSEPVSATIPG